MKLIIAMLIGGLLVPVAFWLGGYNFDERGSIAVICFVCSLIIPLTILVHWDEP